jgi:hypothetical protein
MCISWYFHIQLILYVQLLFFFNCAIYKVMWKNILEPDRPQMTNGACTLCIGYLRLQTHRIYNTYCFSTTKMVAQTCLTVTLYIHCLFFFYCWLCCWLWNTVLSLLIKVAVLMGMYCWYYMQQDAVIHIYVCFVATSTSIWIVLLCNWMPNEQVTGQGFDSW